MKMRETITRHSGDPTFRADKQRKGAAKCIIGAENTNDQVCMYSLSANIQF